MHLEDAQDVELGRRATAEGQAESALIQVAGLLATTNVCHFPMFERLQPPYAAA